MRRYFVAFKIEISLVYGCRSIRRLPGEGEHNHLTAFRIYRDLANTLIPSAGFAFLQLMRTAGIMEPIAPYQVTSLEHWNVAFRASLHRW